MMRDRLAVASPLETLRYGRPELLRRGRLPAIAGAGDFLLMDGMDYEAGGFLTASSAGTALTSGAANTKGSWVQLIASTAREATGLLVQPGGTSSNTALGNKIDIGIGAAASEQVLVPDLTISNGPSTSVRMPVQIPAGSRLSARFASPSASQGTTIWLTTLQEGFASPSAPGRITAYGPATLASPGGANTKSAYTQLVASTANSCSQVVIGVSGTGGTAAAIFNNVLDLAIGAAAAEQIVLPDFNWPYSYTTSGSPGTYYYGPFPLAIPAATRLSARYQNSNASLNPAMTVTVYGIE